MFPRGEDIFNMFRMIHPRQVKVVLVGQSPYPGRCPVTQIPYACGPAFLPAPGCVTTPATLRNIVTEVCRDLGKKPCKTPRNMLLDWIDQGVMLLNSSLTLGAKESDAKISPWLPRHNWPGGAGTNYQSCNAQVTKFCPKYLEDHSVTWEEVMHHILVQINKTGCNIFVLIGKDAWKFETFLDESRVLKVSHPGARNEPTTPRPLGRSSAYTAQEAWIGASVFSKVSNLMIDMNMVPIKWI